MESGDVLVGLEDTTSPSDSGVDIGGLGDRAKSRTEDSGNGSEGQEEGLGQHDGGC